MLISRYLFFIVFTLLLSAYQLKATFFQVLWNELGIQEKEFQNFVSIFPINASIIEQKIHSQMQGHPSNEIWKNERISHADLIRFAGVLLNAENEKQRAIEKGKRRFKKALQMIEKSSQEREAEERSQELKQQIILSQLPAHKLILQNKLAGKQEMKAHQAILKLKLMQGTKKHAFSKQNNPNLCQPDKNIKHIFPGKNQTRSK